MKNEVLTCPIYFENHEFGGHLYSIEEFTNINFGTVRTTFLNGKPYFSAKEIANNLWMNPTTYRTIVHDCIIDVERAIERGIVSNIHPQELYFYLNIEISHKANNCNKEVKQNVQTLFISEPVIYLLMFKSRKPEASDFKVWLATEILPNLRIIGKDKAAIMLQKESNRLIKALDEVNQKYKDMKELAEKNGLMYNGLAEILLRRTEHEDINMNILDAKVNELAFKLDSIGYGQNYLHRDMNNNTINLSKQISDIASGLNTIFGKK